MKEIKNVLDKINASITNNRLLNSELEAILLSISDQYDSTIVGMESGETFFDICYDSKISFSNRQTHEESTYYFDNEAGKFVY